MLGVPPITRRLAAVSILVLCAVLWVAAPNDVVELVAEQDDVLLGRYSLGQFSALAILTALLLMLAGLLASRVRFDRELALRAVLVSGSVLLGVVLASLGSHLLVPPRYVERASAPGEGDEEAAGLTRQRQPNQRFEMLRADDPPAPRSYAQPPPGFPSQTITLTTDEHGLRNPERRARYDAVAVGDSFTEGSMVSDDQVWPVLLGRETGCSVYNLGISGGTPRQYLGNFLSFGVELEPRLAIVLVYEGNDFKQHREEQPRSAFARFRDFVFKDAPLRARLNRWLVQTLGPVRSGAPLPESPALAWMPVAVHSPAGVHHYAFEPKRLVRLDWARDEFERAPEWTGSAAVFREIRDQAERRGIRLVLAYAPSTPHVVMPLVRDRVSPEELRAFAALERDDLPPPARFHERFFERIDVQESVFLGFCAAEGIECVSTTAPLREAMARGEQVYFSYDPHWTPFGHAVAARAIAEHLRARGLAPCAPAGDAG
jgi:hypothetical protein